MRSHSVIAEKIKKHGYVNVPSDPSMATQGSGYAVPRPSAESPVGEVRPLQKDSLLDDDLPLTLSRLPDPMQPLVPSTAGATALAGLTETSTEDAMMPRSVRFLSNANQLPGSSRLSSASTNDTPQSRPLAAPARSHSQRQTNTQQNTFSPPNDFNISRRSSEGEVHPVPKPRQSKTEPPKSSSSSNNGSQSLRHFPNILSEHSETVVPQSVSSSGRVGVHGNPAFDSIRKDSEFSDSNSAVIRSALQKHGNDQDKARVEIRVSKLMDMGIPNINETDCVRALSHCQQKTDRAAEWLLQISDDIEERAQ